MAWTRLIRFQDDAGATRFGEPVIDSAEDLNLLLERGELFASDFEGCKPICVDKPNLKAARQKILGILTPEDVPVIKCISLNYTKYIQGGQTPPPYLSI